MWTFAYKFEGAQLVRFKARQAIAGHKGVLTPGIDYDPHTCYHGAASLQDLMLLTNYALNQELHTAETDIKRAYLSAQMPDRPDGTKVMVRQGSGTRMFAAKGSYAPGTQDMTARMLNLGGFDAKCTMSDGATMTSESILMTNTSGEMAEELICTVWRAWYGHPVASAPYLFKAELLRKSG